MASPASLLIVETAQGRLKGASETDVAGTAVASWKGIPFAKPPIGGLRFRAPQAAEPWTGVRDATRYGSPCIQLPFFSSINAPIVGSEDCLTLNVWSPAADEHKRPVLLWIHGGGWVMGTSAQYDGSLLAARGDVVVVTINYRLGPWGFLYLNDLPAQATGASPAPSPNPGLLDIVAALSWVKENVARFGGDPSNVTILGQSAGGMLVGTLLAMPAARGLFHRAIALSGAARNVRDRALGTRIAEDLLTRVGLTAHDVNRLRDVPAEKLYRAGAEMLVNSIDGELNVEPFLPVIDGNVLPKHPVQAVAAGEGSDVPLLVATARDEMTIMVPECPQVLTGKEAYLRRKLGEPRFRQLEHAYRCAADPGRDWLLELLNDTMFWVPAIRLAEASAHAHRPVWMMRIDYRLSLPPFHEVGASHLTDCLLLFELFSNWGKPVASHGTSSDKSAAAAFQDLIVRFARDGRPGSPRFPEWPRYDATTRATLILDIDSHIENDPLSGQRHAWDGLDEVGAASFF
jgi:para-nitrobenzyl esterase